MVNLIVYVFVSGLALFIGAAMLTLGVAVGLVVRGRLGRSAGRGLVIAGLVFVWLSATPMPLWAAVALSALAGAWLVAEMGCRRWGPCLLQVCSCVLVTFAGACVLAELPHQLRPNLPSVGTRTVYVIGDSISGGVGIENEALWPADLDGLMPGRRVVNLAVPGATCATALAQARRVPEQGAYVLLEIGGNDLLGRASPAAFRRDLQALLLQLSTGDRTLVMFELPLPSFLRRLRPHPAQAGGALRRHPHPQALLRPRHHDAGRHHRRPPPVSQGA